MSALEQALGGPVIEVVAKATRRRFTVEYKRKIVREADACKTPGAVGADERPARGPAADGLQGTIRAGQFCAGSCPAKTSSWRRSWAANATCRCPSPISRSRS